MTDCGFPILEYAADQSPIQRGLMHGEQFRSEIAELAEIRLALMREKNPSLTVARVNELADQQWEATANYDASLCEELQGIVDGSKLSRAQITVLNNYTDFRDIQLADDQGCSVIYVNYDQTPVAGQTWDMHSSAKRYVSVIKICDERGLESVVFSLVGCIGMMGFTRLGTTVQVNNINTDGAVAGAMWPAVVRKTLQFPKHSQMSNHLSTAPVTSGHNYLLASQERAEMWEVMPGLAECVDFKSGDEEGSLFHTNHCLGHNSVERETTISQNSTTHVRFGLIEKKIPAVKTYAGVYSLLNDHENYPKSICSNFQSSAQDPSVTCGGAIGNLNSGQVEMWRGDEVHDENFVKHTFQF